MKSAKLAEATAAFERYQAAPELFENPADLAQLAARFIELKQFAQAHALLDPAIASYPADFHLNDRVADLALREKQYETAIRHWSACLSAYPGKATAGLLRKFVAALRHARLLDDARSTVLSGLQRFADSVPLLAELAEIETADRQLGKAAECWRKVFALCRKPAPASYTLSYARVLRAQGNVPACVDILRSAQAQYPADVRLQSMLGKLAADEMIDVEVIAELADTYRFTYFRQRSGTDTLVVTFGTLFSTLDTPAFGFPFLTHEGYDHIHVAQGTLRQYQELSLARFQEVVEPLCRGKRVFTYGSSLGGYAAIYFASAIGACALAASPVLSAHPLATRFSGYKIPILHEPLEYFRSAFRTYIFFDPNEAPDSLFVRECLLPCCSNAVLVPLAFSGHQSLRILSSAGLLQDTIRHIVRHIPDRVEIDENLLQATPVYLEELMLHQERQGSLDRAFETGQRCLQVEPRLRVFNALVRIAMKRNQPALADQLYRTGLLYFSAERLTPPASSAKANGDDPID